MMRYLHAPIPLQAALGLIAVLLLILASYALVNSFSLRLPPLYRLAATALFVSCFLLLNAISNVELPVLYQKPLPLLGRSFAQLPITTVAALLLLTGAVAVLLLLRLRRTRKSILTSQSIKESLDALPDGVCYASQDGLPLLVNLQMNRLCGELFGTELLNTHPFWQALQAGSFCENARLLHKEPNPAVQLPDGSVWDFHQQVLTLRDSPVLELTAYDITRLYRLNQKLSRRNQRLKLLGQRLHQFKQDLEQVTKDQEILNAKMKVHDQLGHSLLALRAYLAQPSQERDRQMLLTLWEQAVSSLSQPSTDPRPNKDPRPDQNLQPDKDPRSDQNPQPDQNTRISVPKPGKKASAKPPSSEPSRRGASRLPTPDPLQGGASKLPALDPLRGGSSNLLDSAALRGGSSNLLDSEGLPGGRNDWENFLTHAEALHIQVERSGPLPAPGLQRELLLAALRECLSNTAKHTDGNQLYVCLTYSSGYLTAEISNNGLPPEAPIRETGGLKNLRLQIEHCGGSMTIYSSPAFLLRAQLPSGKEYLCHKQAQKPE